MIRKGNRNGPACCDEEGNLAQGLQYQETFFHFLTEIQQEHPDIISEDDNVGENYGIGGYLRRGAYVRYIYKRARESVINAINQ